MFDAELLHNVFLQKRKLWRSIHLMIRHMLGYMKIFR